MLPVTVNGPQPRLRAFRRPWILVIVDRCLVSHGDLLAARSTVPGSCPARQATHRRFEGPLRRPAVGANTMLARRCSQTTLGPGTAASPEKGIAANCGN